MGMMDSGVNGLMKRLLPLLMVWCNWVMDAGAQTASKGTIETLQDSLVKLGYTMYNEPGEPERLEANFTFVKTLVTALKTPHSYSFPFDSLNMVSILHAPDNRFRVFSWHVQLNDGSYLYYGAIQLNTPDGSLKLFPLLDKTYEIPQPETAVAGPSTWYGAQYYHIIPIDGAYVLLGWKGHTPGITQKVIEVLQLKENDVVLGKTIFDGEDTGHHARMIYRYSKQASMYMVYDRAANRIVMDHLSPTDNRHQGQYEQYGPDLTYDAWQIHGGRLRLVPDIPLTNPPDPNDEQYNDPRKGHQHPKSGFSAN